MNSFAKRFLQNLNDKITEDIAGLLTAMLTVTQHQEDSL